MGTPKQASGLTNKDSACGGQVGGASPTLPKWIPVFTGMTLLR